MKNIVISTFYKFITLSHCEAMRESLLAFCEQYGLKGTILLAREGINSTLSGERPGIDALYSHLKTTHGIELTNIKESFLEYKPFKKMKVRVKKEIVKLGLPEVDGTKAGYYVKPEAWDDFIAQEDVLVIDTRNSYEVELGSFRDAINPLTESFQDFPQWFEAHKENFIGKKIAMVCTGGVRCEKSTAYLKTRGFEEVYHLDGGILNYLEKMGDKGKSWYGECFVFDERIAVDSALTPRKLTSESRKVQ